MPAASGSFYDYCRAVTCNTASGRRASEAVDRCADYDARDWRPKATFNCCRPVGNSTCHNDPTSRRRCTDGCWPVLNRSAGQGPVPRRHGRVGKPRFQGLSFCRDAELRDDQERCVYVRKRRHCCRVSSGQE